MIPFTKMHGLGNDFILLDGVGRPLPAEDFPSLSQRLNDRRFGIGGDGLILVERGERAPFRMRMFNPDGSESEMCGNGVRCFAKFLKDHDYSADGAVKVETGAGILTLGLEADGKVRVDMGTARLLRGDIPMAGEPEETFIDQPITASEESFRGTAVSMGNPHLVLFVEDAHAIDLQRIGPAFERHELFPRRTNVHFAQRLDERTLIQRTWERGAGATLACGTGACAVAVAGYLTGRSGRSVEVRLPGGSLSIEYAESGQVFMTGPAETVFTGCWVAHSSGPWTESAF